MDTANNTSTATGHTQWNPAIVGASLPDTIALAAEDAEQSGVAQLVMEKDPAGDGSQGIYYGCCPASIQPTDGWVTRLVISPAPAQPDVPMANPLARAAAESRNALQTLIGLDEQRLILNGSEIQERIQHTRASLQRAVASIDGAARDMANALVGAQLTQEEATALENGIYGLAFDDPSRALAFAAIDRLRGK